MAGIFGPVLVNYIRQYKIEHGVAKAATYAVASRSRLGICRHRARLGCDPDAVQRTEAAPAAALIRRRQFLLHEPEQPRLQCGIRLQRFRTALVRDLAVDQHIGAIDDGQHLLGVCSTITMATRPRSLTMLPSLP